MSETDPSASVQAPKAPDLWAVAAEALADADRAWSSVIVQQILLVDEPVGGEKKKPRPSGFYQFDLHFGAVRCVNDDEAEAVAAEIRQALSPAFAKARGWSLDTALSLISRKQYRQACQVVEAGREWVLSVSAAGKCVLINGGSQQLRLRVDPDRANALRDELGQAAARVLEPVRLRRAADAKDVIEGLIKDQ